MFVIITEYCVTFLSNYSFLKSVKALFWSNIYFKKTAFVKSDSKSHFKVILIKLNNSR